MNNSFVRNNNPKVSLELGEAIKIVESLENYKDWGKIYSWEPDNRIIMQKQSEKWKYRKIKINFITYQKSLILTRLKSFLEENNLGEYFIGIWKHKKVKKSKKYQSQVIFQINPYGDFYLWSDVFDIWEQKYPDQSFLSNYI